MTNDSTIQKTLRAAAPPPIPTAMPALASAVLPLDVKTQPWPQNEVGALLADLNAETIKIGGAQAPAVPRSVEPVGASAGKVAAENELDQAAKKQFGFDNTRRTANAQLEATKLTKDAGFQTVKDVMKARDTALMEPGRPVAQPLVETKSTARPSPRAIGVTGPTVDDLLGGYPSIAPSATSFRPGSPVVSGLSRGFSGIRFPASPGASFFDYQAPSQEAPAQRGMATIGMSNRAIGGPSPADALFGSVTNGMQITYNNNKPTVLEPSPLALPQALLAAQQSIPMPAPLRSRAPVSTSNLSR